MVAPATAKSAIVDAFKYGHAFDPDYPELHGLTLQDVKSLDPEHKLAKLLLRSWSKFQVTTYAPAVFRAHGRPIPDFDGEFGPAAKKLAETPRCPIPDFFPPEGSDDVDFGDQWVNAAVREMRAVRMEAGSGNWRGCNGVGDEFHSVGIEFDLSQMSSHVREVFKQLAKDCRSAFARFGLALFIVNKATGTDIVTGKKFNGTFGIQASFVGRSSGWIGLAEVLRGLTCSSRPLFAKFLNRYRPENVLREWLTLLKHEFVHNCGHGHSRGGVNNPVLVPGLPIHWQKNDPGYDWLWNDFGGKPYVFGDDQDDDSDDPDPPTDDIAKQLQELRFQSLVTNAVQDAIIADLNLRVMELENK